MKILYTVPFILFASCDSNEVKNLKGTLTSYEATDSLLQRSKDRMVEVSKIAGKSDSVISTNVDKTVNKIQNLNNAVKVLKRDNRELRSRLGNDDDDKFKLLPIDQSTDVDITTGSEPTE